MGTVRAGADKNNGLMDDAFDLLETIASLDGANYIDEHVDEGLLVLCESICDISVLPAGNLATSLVRRVNNFLLRGAGYQLEQKRCIAKVVVSCSRLSPRSEGPLSAP